MGRTILRGPLGAKEQEELAEIQRTARSYREFNRARGIALVAGGYSVRKVAEVFGVTPAAVYGWIGRYRRSGALGLRAAERSGRPRVYDRKFRRDVRRIVERGPRQWGLEWTVWTVLTLAGFLFDQTRRWISPSHLRRVLREEGYVWRRPKLSLRHRQNRRLHKAVQRLLRGLERKADRPGADSVLLYGDECEAHLNPGLTGMWMRRGRQKEVPSAGQDFKVAVFGAVNYATGRLVWRTARRKNQHEFLAFLVEVLRHYPSRRILLVLDNVSYHKTAAVREFLAQHRDRLEVIWLPPYSPSLNRIERVWKHLKSHYLYNEFFGDGQGLIRALHAGLRALNGNLFQARGILTAFQKRRYAA